MKIQRYTFRKDFNDCIRHDRNPDGEWARFSDIQPLIERLREAEAVVDAAQGRETMLSVLWEMADEYRQRHPKEGET